MARSLGRLYCAINNVAYPPTDANASLNGCAGSPGTKVSLGTDFEITLKFDKESYNFNNGSNDTGMSADLGTGLYGWAVNQSWNYVGYSNDALNIAYNSNDANQGNYGGFAANWTNNDFGGGSYTIYFGTFDGSSIYTKLYEFYGADIQTSAGVTK